MHVGNTQNEAVTINSLTLQSGKPFDAKFSFLCQWDI